MWVLWQELPKVFDTHCFGTWFLLPSPLPSLLQAGMIASWAARCLNLSPEAWAHNLNAANRVHLGKPQTSPISSPAPRGEPLDYKLPPASSSEVPIVWEGDMQFLATGNFGMWIADLVLWLGKYEFLGTFLQILCVYMFNESGWIIRHSVKLRLGSSKI